MTPTAGCDERFVGGVGCLPGTQVLLRSPVPMIAGEGALDVLPMFVSAFSPAIVVGTPDLEWHTARVIGVLRRAGIAVRGVEASDGQPHASAVLELASQLRKAGCVVAVGGGSVMDTTKLATLLSASPEAARLVRNLERAPGIVPLPPAVAHRTPIIAVPTSLGTSSEVNAVAAVVAADGRRRLVASSALRPDAAVLEPALTATLTATALIEGAVESLLRVLIPLLGPDTPRPFSTVSDHAALTLIRTLRQLIDRALDGDLGVECRLSVGLATAETQMGLGLFGRLPNCNPLWYLAQPVVDATETTKVGAMVALMPAFEAVLAVDSNLAGEARSAASANSDPERLTTWLTGLIRHPQLSHLDPATLASEAASLWGPQLAEVGPQRVASVYRRACSKKMWPEPATFP